MRRRVSGTGRHLDHVSVILGELLDGQHGLQGGVFLEVPQSAETLALRQGQRRILVASEVLVLCFSEVSYL